MRFILFLCLGVTLCMASPQMAKRELPVEGESSTDLCDALVDYDEVPSWMTICDVIKENDVTISRRCIFTDWVCDGTEDCDDGSDEDHPQCADDEGSDLCVRIDENGVVPWWMRVCDDQAKCIFADWVCDGEPDCFDHSDEDGCDSGGEEEIDLCDYKTETGPEWLTVCESGDQCIVTDWLCDKEQDCMDGSDERKKDCKEAWSQLTGGYRSGKK